MGEYSKISSSVEPWLSNIFFIWPYWVIIDHYGIIEPACLIMELNWKKYGDLIGPNIISNIKQKWRKKTRKNKIALQKSHTSLYIK